jgi:hypothetical protein
MLILMVIYLVALSQRWDETISFFMYNNKIIFIVPVFENFQDNYDKRKVVCPAIVFSQQGISLERLDEFIEILNISSTLKKINYPTGPIQFQINFYLPQINVFICSR